MTDNLGIDWLLTGEPRPAQIEALSRSYLGIKWRNKASQDIVSPVHLPHCPRPALGWGHFMEMRVGKTPTALNEFMLFKRDHGVNKGFMLSPNRYKATWGTEAAHFGLDVPIHVFESKNRKEFAEFMRTNKGQGGFVVANYEALIYEDNTKLFAEWIDNKTYMGADESVMLKNKDSQFFKNAMTLSKDAAVTRPMTGLPTPNAPFDIWAQLRFARQLNGQNFYSFKHTFTKMGGFKNKKALGLKNEEQLLELLNDVCFKARRADWGTKINSDFERVSIDMLPAQKKAYQEMERDFVTWLDESDTLVSADQVMTKRMKMQQISSGFVIDEEGKAHDLVPFHKTPKFIDVLDRLTNEVSGKVIIIAHYTHTILNLLEALKQFDPAIIAGNTTMKRVERDAESEKNRFNNSSKCRVIIGQSQAIKYGHTLMGNTNDPCLSMGFFENNYSLDNRAQTEERPQGEGQQAAIHVWDYFSSGIERDIIKALQDKRNIADTIMAHYKGQNK